MDSQVLFNIAVAIAGFFGGWILNNIHKSIDKLDTDVRAIQTMQKALGTKPDGVIGPKTLAALRAADPTDLIAKFSMEKELFYKSLPTFATFGKGWLRRVDETRSHAVTMLA